MNPALLALACALAPAAEPAAAPDPSTLVARLGAGRFAEREAASAALEDLGRDALSALRAAREAPDPEIRSRAEVLLDRIEGTLLVQATPLRLDVDDEPMDAVVRDLARQLRAELKLISPEPSRRVTVHEDHPLPFWEAMDRLGLSGRWSPGNPPPPYGDGRPPVLNLVARKDDSRPSRVQVRGPFRVELSGPTRLGRSEVAFGVEVQAEPGRTLRRNGPVRVLEAVDDTGASLVPPDPPAEPPIEPQPRFNRFGPVDPSDVPSPRLNANGSLRPPLRPNVRLARLRAVVPVVVLARRDEPRTIPLAPADKAIGKSFSTDEATFVLLNVRDEPADGIVTLDLAVQPHGLAFDPVPLRGRARFMADFRQGPPDRIGDQLEVIDARGRPLPLASARPFPNVNGIRLSLTFGRNGPDGGPAQVRFYETSRAEAEIEFDFADLPVR